MKKIHAIIAAAAALSLMSAAVAEEVLTVKLQAPLAKPTEIVTDNGIYACKDDTCSGGSLQGVAWSVAGCRALVRQVGAVSAYGGSTKQLTADELANCNKSAKKS